MVIGEWKMNMSSLGQRHVVLKMNKSVSARMHENGIK